MKRGLARLGYRKRKRRELLPTHALYIRPANGLNLLCGRRHELHRINDLTVAHHFKMDVRAGRPTR